MKHALRCVLDQRITTIREQHASGGKLVRHQIQHSMCNFLIIPHSTEQGYFLVFLKSLRPLLTFRAVSPDRAGGYNINPYWGQFYCQRLAQTFNRAVTAPYVAPNPIGR